MAKPKILIAEDSEANQEFLSDLFISKGFEVINACDGKKATELFDKKTPDISLVDIKMPQKNGLEVLKYIKSRSPYSLVVMMTAHGSEETAVETMKLGADDYLIKPFLYKNVLTVVHKLLSDNKIRLENINLHAKIRQAEENLAHLIENVNEAIISTTLDGEILSFNKAAEKLWHVKENEMIGDNIAVLFKNGEKNGYVMKILEMAKKKGKYRGEFIFTRKIYSEFPGDLSASLVKDKKGRRNGIVAIIRDITNEKMLREQLIESARLASLGNIVDGIAHEVRNPLISIGGFARRMETVLGNVDETRKYLDLIIKNVNKLERMVSSIEDYVGFAKQHDINFNYVDVAEIIRKVISKFDFKSKNITLQLPDKQISSIVGDKKYLEELFYNLFENAMEAMPGGGSISVSFETDDRYLKISIEDDGCGIPENELNDIYDPFYTSKMSGSGTGLAKVYMIVEDHQGFISVKSVEGKGARFCLKLPLERRQVVRT